MRALSLLSSLFPIVIFFPVLAKNSRREFPLSQRRYAQALREISPELTKRDGSKYVFMHHIVGNTYPYTRDDWAKDISEIAAIGVRLLLSEYAIALNVGSDAWQWDRVVDAYAAATASNTGLKLFISFDYSSFVCDNGATTVNWTNYFAKESAQFFVNGKPMLSTWGGGYDCLGVSNWKTVKSKTNAYLMPFFWDSENTFKTDWAFLDSWYCWGCAWPQGDWNKNTTDDVDYMNRLGPGRYATTISGWMFTHLSNKNFYLRGDDWLLLNRWEELIAMRSELTFIEMVTWNDWGESDYFGPFAGAQPDGTYWAEDYPHQAWLELSKYYIPAFKTGVYPAITQDVVYWWCRPHKAAAVATADRYAKPTGWNWADDYLWAAVFCTSTCTVTLTLGSSSQTFTNLPAGVSKLKLPMAVGNVGINMVKGSQTVISASPTGFSVVATPSQYNYNVFVGAETVTVTVSATTTTSTQASTSASTSTSTSSSTSMSTTSTSRSTSTSASASSTITSASTSTSSTSSMSLSSSSTASSTSAASTTTSTTLTYFGCVAEGTTGTRRALTGPSLVDSAMTPAKCQAFCKGYSYAGTEYGTQCYCGNSLRNNGATGAVNPSSNCNSKCGGDSSQYCGGSWFLSVYSTGASTTTSSTTFKSLGCAAEGVTGTRRPLTGASYTDNKMTPALCQSLCSAYIYAGTEYGNECYCGNTLKNNGATGTIVASSNCNSVCAGDSTQKCGGGYFLSLYQRTS